MCKNGTLSSQTLGKSALFKNDNPAKTVSYGRRQYTYCTFLHKCLKLWQADSSAGHFVKQTSMRPIP
jgi:hypothetical protein